jgi:ABC-type dipeptide/oligopeptide/nickel transport system ATPase subunit
MSPPELSGEAARSRSSDAAPGIVTAPDGQSRSFAPRWKVVVRRLLSQREASVFLMLALVAGYLSIASAYFLEPRNLLNIGRQFSVVGMVAIGQALVIISRGIDLSVGSVIGLAAVVSALIAKLTGSPAAGLALGLLVGALVGLINGFLYTRIKINPFIATLGMLSVARGVALLITGGLPVPFENWVAFLGSGRLASVRNVLSLNLSDTKAERRKVQQLFQRLGIRARSLDQEILYLSGGNQQKAILARCLAVGPRVLLLDEPTHGVDVRTKAELYQIVDELGSQGIGIVMVSSEIPEILAVASTIIVLAHGKQGLVLRNEGLEDKVLLEAAFHQHPVATLESIASHRKEPINAK